MSTHSMHGRDRREAKARKRLIDSTDARAPGLLAAVDRGEMTAVDADKLIRRGR